jgi:hypothetical protein
MQQFRAAFANLDSFVGSVEISWRISEDGDEILDEIQWGEAGTAHKKSLGAILGLWHQKSASKEYDDAFSSDDWCEVFDQRETWHVSVEELEIETGVCKRVTVSRF